MTQEFDYKDHDFKFIKEEGSAHNDGIFECKKCHFRVYKRAIIENFSHDSYYYDYYVANGIALFSIYRDYHGVDFYLNCEEAMIRNIIE